MLPYLVAGRTGLFRLQVEAMIETGHRVCREVSQCEYALPRTGQLAVPYGNPPSLVGAAR